MMGVYHSLSQPFTADLFNNNDNNIGSDGIMTE